MSTLRTLLLFLLLVLVPRARAEEGATMSAAPDPIEVSEIPPLPAGWIDVTGASVQVHGPPGEEPLLERLADHTDDVIVDLAAKLGVPVGPLVHVVVADTEETFFRLQPGAPPEWADGTAWPGIGWIYLHNPKIRSGVAKPVEQVLDHEVIHILLGRAFAPTPTPRWLQEGVAQVYSGEAGPDLSSRIAQGLLLRSAYPLAAITQGFPADAAGAELAYAQSADFVQWYRGTYGDDSVRTMIRQVAAGRSVSGALLDITGSTLDQVDVRWRARYSTGWPRWLVPENLANIAWAGLGLGFAVIAVQRRRQRRDKIGSWDPDSRPLQQLARATLWWRRDRNLASPAYPPYGPFH